MMGYKREHWEELTKQLAHKEAIGSVMPRHGVLIETTPMDVVQLKNPARKTKATARMTTNASLDSFVERRTVRRGKDLIRTRTVASLLVEYIKQVRLLIKLSN